MKVCIVTGTRAEYGYLKPLMQAVQKSDKLSLQLIVTGAHLSDTLGSSFEIIEQDGFAIDCKVDILDGDFSATGIARASSKALTGIANALDTLKPDLLVLLGDRYEIFAAASAGLLLKIPMAHISGGDVTEGAYDDAMRHAITKMAHLHFPTNNEAAKRIIRLGEHPDRVHLAGATSLDALKDFEFMSRSEIEKTLDFELRAKNLLITYHPVTLDNQPPDVQIDALLSALDSLGPDYGHIITMPNADTHRDIIVDRIEKFAVARENVIACDSLGQTLYFNAIKHTDASIGNSSSGLIEVPFLGKPTVNIGDRQKGRLRGASVIDCPPETDAIIAAIGQALALEPSLIQSPYGTGDACTAIMDVLENLENTPILLQKGFYDYD